MAHDQARTCLARHGMQLGIERDQRFADELHAAVNSWQSVQDGFIKHEHAMHLLAAFEGVVERCVVKSTQVATKPHQPFGHVGQMM